MPVTVNTPANNSEIEFYRYSYTVRNIELTLGQKHYTMQDGTCVYCTIQHTFLSRRFPIISIGLEADSDLIGDFFKNKETAQFKLDIYEQQLDSSGTVINTSLYIRNTFNCVLARDESTYLTTPDTETATDIYVMRKLQLLELYLIDMNMVNVFAKEISAILEKCTKSAALQICFSSRDINPGSVIATPPQMEKMISYISLTLGDLVHNIMELYNMYGLYDGMPIIYYDYKYIYCLNSLKPDIILESPTEFGNVTFRLLNQSDDAHNIEGSATLYDQKTHITNLQDIPDIYDTSERNSSTKFSTLLSVNSTGTINQTTLDSDVTKANFIRAQNELAQEQYVNEVMRGHVVTITTRNCCVSVLKPYKSYRFDVGSQYADKKLTGHEYRILGYTLDIRRNQPDQYIHSVTIQLQQPYENGQATTT